VDQRPITDRDLNEIFLSEAAARYARLVARSQSHEEIVRAAQPSIAKYATEIHREGMRLVAQFREGRQPWAQLDGWMGKFADYLELAECSPKETAEASMTPSVQNLLAARSVGDLVLLADLLEYEVLPRVSTPTGAR
jgi:hypothetical protein